MDSGVYADGNGGVGCAVVPIACELGELGIRMKKIFLFFSPHIRYRLGRAA